MFQVACATLEIDLITFDFSSPKPAFFPIKHGFVRQALDRGIFFEIIYSGSILDVNRRKQAIMTGQAICRVSKGKNIILTSGADSEWILRAPADAMNLAGIFGIPPHHRKQALQDNQRKLIEHAASRKLTYRTAVATIPENIYKGEKEADNDLQEDFIRF
jgi:ribonuclease P/MRP protein subunit RPP1